MDIGVIKSFAKSLTAKFALPGAASPEDQLKPLVAGLLTEAGASFGWKVESRTEVHLSEHKVRPDIAIYVSGLISGYIELKQPGLGADAPKLKGDHNKKQWQKLKGLPNLIYTDGQDWALYHEGERKGSIIRLKGDPTKHGEGAVDKQNATELGALLKSFLGWSPTVPHQPTALAKYLAPLTRFLRSEVETALATEGSAIDLLAKEWRQFFFPDADDAQFADAYAQTVTYAMLLARLSGATKLDPTDAAKTLDKNNGLLARTLEILGQRDARDELCVGFELLQRSLEELNPADFLKTKPDLWLYFYENFLAAYDPKLRKDYGVYYTPHEVVELQVRLASDLLEKRFKKKLGFADDGVVFLDPAVGTGTYPVAVVKHALEKVRVRSGDGAVPGRAEQMAVNMYGLEILVGPYAVAHLRLTQALEGSGANVKERLKIYLADTLESPTAKPSHLSLQYRVLTQEHEAARKLKNEGDILVCLGNPPYDRQQIEEGNTTTQRKGGWVRFGDQIKGGAKQEEQGVRPILEDFLEPARKAGAGVHLKNLYNDYVYFWRWALWRLFEQQKCGGIITFITASSFLGGPGFVGLREMMRREFDEIYIINLGGDLLGTRKTPNVFNIQTPVAITIGVRGKQPMREVPAKANYFRVEAGTRKDKLKILDGILSFSNVTWEDVSDGWHDPFYPKAKAEYFVWPEIVDIFPWQHSGAQMKRVWPIGETEEVLLRRWSQLVTAPLDVRRSLFKETRDRKIERAYRSFDGVLEQPVAALGQKEQTPKISRYAYRQFDRQFAFLDNRVGDYLRPPLVSAFSENNVFLNTLITKMIGEGSAVGISAYIPDLDIFCGRGGRDVIPLYRDATATQPNVTAGLLATLSKAYDDSPTVEDLLAYVYALLGGQSYTKRFWNELETPCPRVPITKDGKIFGEAATLGRHLIWLHTYAERFRGVGRGDEVPAGVAKNISGISFDPEKYPEEFEYIEGKLEVRVGDGIFHPVAPEIWEFDVSGLKVVQSWLGYRMKKRSGKKSSPLDNIRPERWTPRMTEEFLELLWVLEATLAMEPELSAVLDKVVGGECFKESELPTPTLEERKAPIIVSAAGDLIELMEDDTEAGNDDE